MSLLFTASGITLTAEIQSGLTLCGDKDLLQQMIANLLDNVMLHAAGASLMTIRVAQAGKRIGVEIADNGTGIPADQMARVFQRFARLENRGNPPAMGSACPSPRGNRFA